MKKDSIRSSYARQLLFTTSLLLTTALTLSVSHAAFAQSSGLDANSQKALDETKAMLNNRSQIDAFTKSNSEAAQADQNVKALMGNNAADTSAVYQLSSDIFETIAKQTNGDPAAMQKLLSEAMKNPAAFAQKLTPEQRAKLSGLAQKAEAVKPSASKP